MFRHRTRTRRGWGSQACLTSSEGCHRQHPIFEGVRHGISQAARRQCGPPVREPGPRPAGARDAHAGSASSGRRRCVGVASALLRLLTAAHRAHVGGVASAGRRRLGSSPGVAHRQGRPSAAGTMRPWCVVDLVLGPGTRAGPPHNHMPARVRRCGRCASRREGHTRARACARDKPPGRRRACVCRRAGRCALPIGGPSRSQPWLWVRRCAPVERGREDARPPRLCAMCTVGDTGDVPEHWTYTSCGSTETTRVHYVACAGRRRVLRPAVDDELIIEVIEYDHGLRSPTRGLYCICTKVSKALLPSL